jgi:hypothetical protein
MSEIFDNLLKDKTYSELLERLPEDEREKIKESLRQIVELFENRLIIPLKNLKGK